jgi:Sulfatase
MRRVRAAGRPYFALVHFMESHVPYAPPPAHARRFLDEADRRRVAALNHDAMAFLAGANPLGDDDLALISSLYDATVSYGDELLGRVLDAAGDDSLVVLTADHGHHFGEHGLVGHFFSVYETVAHVPLVVRHPGLPAGRVERPVQSLDLFPTVLEAAGVDPGPLPGASACARRATLGRCWSRSTWSRTWAASPASATSTPAATTASCAPSSTTGTSTSGRRTAARSSTTSPATRASTPTCRRPSPTGCAPSARSTRHGSPTCPAARPAARTAAMSSWTRRSPATSALGYFD